MSEEKQVMRVRSILAFLLAIIVASSGTAVGQTTAPAKTSAPQEKQTTLPKLPAAFCKIDVANKTIRVVPWDEKSQEWKRDSIRTLVWNDQTRLVSGAHTLTMPQFIGGQPLSDSTKDLSTILGNRGIFYFSTIDGKDVIQKVEMYAMFGGESFPAMVGNNGAFMVGSSKVSCGDDGN